MYKYDIIYINGGPRYTQTQGVIEWFNTLLKKCLKINYPSQRKNPPTLIKNWPFF